MAAPSLDVPISNPHQVTGQPDSPGDQTRFMPLHLFVSHFPIALITSAAVADVVGTLSGSRDLRRAAGVLLIAGAVAAFVTFVTGQGALSYLLAVARPDAEIVERHTQWGGAGVWGLCGAGALRAAWAARLEGTFGWINLLVAVAAAALVVAIGTTGTAIMHG